MVAIGAVLTDGMMAGARAEMTVWRMVEKMDVTMVATRAVVRVEKTAAERAEMRAVMTAVSMDGTRAEMMAASMAASTAAMTDET